MKNLLGHVLGPGPPSPRVAVVSPFDGVKAMACGQDPVVPSDRTRLREMIRLLDEAMATKWVCVLRYRSHHFTAVSQGLPRIAEEFLRHADMDMAHADRLVRRIVQLGGRPDLSPRSLQQHSLAGHDDSTGLQQMLSTDLAAERRAIESCNRMLLQVAGHDLITQLLLEDILAEEQVHAEQIRDWMADRFGRQLGPV